MSKICTICGCGCEGVCHTLYTCNGSWTCNLCKNEYPLCMMNSIKYLTCAYCAIDDSVSDGADSISDSADGTSDGSDGAVIQWRPPHDPHNMWEQTETIFDEIMFLNNMKICNSAHAVDVLQKCVTNVIRKLS